MGVAGNRFDFFMEKINIHTYSIGKSKQLISLFVWNSTAEPKN